MFSNVWICGCLYSTGVPYHPHFQWASRHYLRLSKRWLQRLVVNPISTHRAHMSACAQLNVITYVYISIVSKLHQVRQLKPVASANRHRNSISSSDRWLQQFRPTTESTREERLMLPDGSTEVDILHNNDIHCGRTGLCWHRGNAESKSKVTIRCNWRQNGSNVELYTSGVGLVFLTGRIAQLHAEIVRTTVSKKLTVDTGVACARHDMFLNYMVDHSPFVPTWCEGERLFGKEINRCAEM